MSYSDYIINVTHLFHCFLYVGHLAHNLYMALKTLSGTSTRFKMTSVSPDMSTLHYKSYLTTCCIIIKQGCRLLIISASLNKTYISTLFSGLIEMQKKHARWQCKIPSLFPVCQII